jgi:hypothetical protein
VFIGFGCRNACGVVDRIDTAESLALSEVEWGDDIFGYDKLVAAEKATLQKGMNYRVGVSDVVARERAVRGRARGSHGYADV